MAGVWLGMVGVRLGCGWGGFACLGCGWDVVGMWLSVLFSYLLGVVGALFGAWLAFVPMWDYKHLLF